MTFGIIFSEISLNFSIIDVTLLTNIIFLSSKFPHVIEITIFACSDFIEMAKI